MTSVSGIWRIAVVSFCHSGKAFRRDEWRAYTVFQTSIRNANGSWHSTVVALKPSRLLAGLNKTRMCFMEGVF